MRVIRFFIICLLSTILISNVQGADYPVQKVLTSNDGRSIATTILFVGENEVFVQLKNNRELEISFEKLSQESVSELRNLNLVGSEAPENPIDGIVLIKTNNSDGSGFFVNQKGRTYIYTNQHVIGNALYVSVTDSRGKNVAMVVFVGKKIRIMVTPLV